MPKQYTEHMITHKQHTHIRTYTNTQTFSCLFFGFMLIFFFFRPKYTTVRCGNTLKASPLVLSGVCVRVCVCVCVCVYVCVCVCVCVCVWIRSTTLCFCVKTAFVYTVCVFVSK